MNVTASMTEAGLEGRIPTICYWFELYFYIGSS